MPRPSLKVQRQVQVLNAYERCVARYGFAGVSLERIACEAGLARGLLRHHVGNRGALKAALIERFFERSASLNKYLREHLPTDQVSDNLITWMFDFEPSGLQDIMIAQALILESASDPALAQQMQAWLEDFTLIVCDALERDFPKASQGAIQTVALGVCFMVFSAETISLLTQSPALKTHYQMAAVRLRDTLVDNEGSKLPE